MLSARVHGVVPVDSRRARTFADGLLREDATVEASAQNQAARAQACMTGLKSEMVMPVCVCGTTPRVRGLTVCASKELS